MNTERTISDEEIVERYFARDEQAIRLTEERYGAYLEILSSRITGDRRDGEECKNDVLMALWQRIPPEKPHCFKAFITRITRNIAIGKLRKRQTDKSIANSYSEALDELYECFELAGNAEKDVEDELLKQTINNFVSGLDKRKRTVFVMRFYLCKTIEEIAGSLGVAHSTVYSDLSAIKEALKKRLEKEDLFYA